MHRRSASAGRGLLLAMLLAVASPLAIAQGRGPGGPPPGGGGGGGGPMGGGGGNVPGMGNPFPGANRAPNANNGGQGGQPGQSGSNQHAGLQLGPPGRWWDDKSFAKSLKLRPDQQTRMDAVFSQNRNALLSHYEELQQAEARIEELSKGPAIDEAALFAQIDRVAQSRVALEKATAHMLLQIRNELDADQISRLDKHR